MYYLRSRRARWVLLGLCGSFSRSGLLTFVVCIFVPAQFDGFPFLFMRFLQIAVGFAGKPLRLIDNIALGGKFVDE